MIPSYSLLRPHYTKLWAELVPSPEHLPELTKICVGDPAQKIPGLLPHKATYQQVSSAVWGDPQYWWYVAINDQMEGGGGACTYLGNGQSLSRVTTEVPAGRGPFASFLAGAIDALKGVSAPTSIERAAFDWEGFNGWGYLSKPIEDPYLASDSNEYTKGKYIADHVYSASAVSGQPGALTILKVLVGLDPSIQIHSDQPEVLPVTTTTAPASAAPQIDMNALAALVAAQLRATAPAAPASAPAPTAASDPLIALLNSLLKGGAGATPQITLASTVAHVNAFMPILGTVLAFLPPPYNAIGTGIQLAQRVISASVDVGTAVQTNPASVGTVLNSHMDVIGALTALLEKQFPVIKPFADAVANAVPKIPAAAAAS
jgi:lysozyme family protein